MELISREEVERLLIKWFTQCTEEEFFDLKKAVDELPTIESRPKGKWIKNEYFWYYHCSVCKEDNLLYTDESNALSNYCPNCGADMRGEE